MWRLSAAMLLCVAMAFGCQGNIIGEGSPGSGGSHGPSGSGGSGSGGSGSGTPCSASSDDLAAATQRVVLLTKSEVVNTVRYLIDDKEAQALIDNAELSQLPGDSQKHFPPKTSDGEQQGFNATNVIPLNNLAEDVSKYVAANFTTLAKCTTPTDACANTYLTTLAAKGYRRQLTSDEQKRFSDLYTTLRSQMVNGYAVTTTVQQAAGYAVWALLMSPQLIWRWEIGKQMSSAPAGVYLTDDELASQLSFFLTDQPPDDMLLTSAKAGTLRTNVASHVSRILQTSASKTWLRQIMQLYFLLNLIPLAPADATKFPVDSGLLSSMATGSQMFLDDVLWNGNLKDLLLSRTTYVNTRLADTVYKIPQPSGVALDKFVKVTLPSDQRSGILTDAGFLAALSRSDGQDLIPRAKIVKAATLCIIPPPPPASIADKVKAAAGAFDKQTGQEQAAARAMTDPCAGCHATFDSFGLALEFYDAIGRYRTTYDYLDNKPIDGTTTLPEEAGGKTIHNAVEMAQALTDTSAFTNCVAKSLLQYSLVDLSAFLALPSSDGKSGCAVADVVQRYQSGPATFTGMVSAITQSPAFALRKLDK